MFEDFKENFLNMVSSRIFVMILVMCTLAAIIINKLFDLQIVSGEAYLDSFETKIMKERTISGSRGCIYDRNGNLLAYNELAHSVAIEDVYESGKMKTESFDILCSNGSRVVQLQVAPRGLRTAKVVKVER